MYKSLKQISVLKCTTNDGLKFSPRTTHYIQIFRRNSGLKEKNAETLITVNEDLSFTSLLQYRQEQAQRSFIVRIPSPEVSSQLIELCRNFGNIKNFFNFKEKRDYVLIEMETEDQLISFVKENLGIHHQSSYRNIFLKLNESKFELNTTEGGSEKLNRHSDEKNTGVNENKTNKKLQCDKHVSLADLILSSYENLKMNDLEARKRFLMCRQTELLCSGFLPNAMAIPFGSSVTGFGTNKCDLDFSLVPLVKNNDCTLSQEDFRFKKEIASEHISSISLLMKSFMYSCNRFVLVKHARVPIFKFKNVFTNVDCDLSLYNLHGVAMSNILYTIGALDFRIRPLVLFMKMWAQKVELVIKGPSTKMSNFSLCLLIIFFLQQNKIVPPWNVFPCEESELVFKDIDLLQCNSFLSDCNTKSKDYESLEELFKQFFEYYSNFDFNKWGVSVKTGCPVKKPNKDPLYIENPLLHNVNVSKNINSKSMGFTRNVFNKVDKLLASEKGNSNVLEKILNLSFDKPEYVNVRNFL